MEVPAEYKNAGLGNLIGGALGALASLSIVVATLCFGFWYLIFAAAHAWQAYVGWQMYNGERVPSAKTASIVGLVCGIFGFNIFAIAGSGFAFMMLGKPEAQGYLEG